MSLQVLPTGLPGLAAWSAAAGTAGPAAGAAAHAPTPGMALPAAEVQAAQRSTPAQPAAAAPPAWATSEHAELSQPMPLAPASSAAPAHEAAAAPLTPAWVGSLQTPAAFTPGWLPAPRPEREPRRRRHAAEPWDEDEEPPSQTRPAQAVPAPRPPAAGALPPLAALPERVRAELARRRSVLLLAAADDSGTLTGWWLGVDAQGRTRARRCALAGEAGTPAAGWRYWHAHRDDERAPARLGTRADQPGQATLQLRLAAGPRPLLAPGELWADLLEPVLARRCLGTQWTWLVACAPSTWS